MLCSYKGEPCLALCSSSVAILAQSLPILVRDVAGMDDDEEDFLRAVAAVAAVAHQVVPAAVRDVQAAAGGARAAPVAVAVGPVEDECMNMVL